MNRGLINQILPTQRMERRWLATARFLACIQVNDHKGEFPRQCFLLQPRPAIDRCPVNLSLHCSLGSILRERLLWFDIIAKPSLGFGDVCPLGHFCPPHSVLPRGCPSGSYQDKEGQTYCEPCPPGYYCHANSTTYLGNDCPAGSYCPKNTSHELQFLCWPGTFNPLTGQKNSSACIPCTAGKYCASSGLYAPTDNCSAGWYCEIGSTNSTPGKRLFLCHWGISIAGCLS